MASGKTQKAIVLTQEAPTVLTLDTHYPIPVRKPGEVLVKTVSSSVNPVDAGLSSGYYKVEAFPKVGCIVKSPTYAPYS
jgi:NADPH:quinone reductase-like Zn-dependent oxidoreductase